MKKIIIYDFDGTLTPYSLPKFEILEKSGIKDGAYNPKFIELVKKKAKEKNIDLYESIYETYFEIITNAGYKLKDENFTMGYEKVEYNKGVEEYLSMLHKEKITNYLLSSGIKVYLKKISISSYFKEIYATKFTYNEELEVKGIEFLMSDKNKVKAIKEILKENNIENEDCSNIIYIGDGLTDYYAMKYIKEHGGISIFVYQDLNNKEMETIKKENIVDFYAKADYSPKSELNNYVKKICKIK